MNITPEQYAEAALAYTEAQRVWAAGEATAKTPDPLEAALKTLGIEIDFSDKVMK